MKKGKQLNHHLEENIKAIRLALSNPDDLKVKVLPFFQKKCAIIYLDTLSDRKTIREQMLNPLLNVPEDGLERFLAVMESMQTDDQKKAIDQILQGNCLFFIDKHPVAYVMETALDKERALPTPSNERIIRGPNIAFNENLDTNVFLIRKQLETKQVMISYYTLGNLTQNRIAIIYLKDIANPDLVKRLEQRIQAISADFVQSPAFKEMIEDRPFSLFPQYLNTERPDRTAAYLNEGSIAVLSEGDPSAALFPVTFFAFFQSADDYTNHFIIATVIRVLRYVAFFISLMLPATYISLLSFHFEALPEPLIFSLQSNLELIPYPPLVEALFMQLTLELLREASIRLAQPIGLTISIVGGLVIGTTVVQANLVSNAMVVVIATTAITSFMIPNSEMSTALRIMGIAITMLSSLFGFLGMMLGVILVLIHLCKLESLGNPYFTPVWGYIRRRDKLIRYPIWMLNKRPIQAMPERVIQESESREWQDDDET